MTKLEMQYKINLRSPKEQQGKLDLIKSHPKEFPDKLNLVPTSLDYHPEVKKKIPVIISTSLFK